MSDIEKNKEIGETKNTKKTETNETQINSGTKEISASKTTERTKRKSSHFAVNKTDANFSQKKATNFRRKRALNKKRVSEFEEKVIDIARVTTVVKGGRRFSFSATVIVGNKKGKVGIGHGKANEVPDAIKKAVKGAQNNLITVPIYNKSTIPHQIEAKYLASKILLKPAPKGKGVIASGTVRNILELAGYTDVYTKTYGSRTKVNASKAALKALSKLRTLEEIAALRDLDPKKILN